MHLKGTVVTCGRALVVTTLVRRLAESASASATDDLVGYAPGEKLAAASGIAASGGAVTRESTELRALTVTTSAPRDFPDRLRLRGLPRFVEANDRTRIATARWAAAHLDENDPPDGHDPGHRHPWGLREMNVQARAEARS